MNADLAQLFDRFEDLGPQGLSKPDAERVAHLIQNDPRCCAELPRSFGTRHSRSAFREVLNRAWVEEEYAEVIDYRRRLLRSASQHKGRRAPLIAVVLYGTWIEHTVNALLISSARLCGPHSISVDDLSRAIVADEFPRRLSKAWSRYRAPALDRIMKRRILKFMELRNDLVHYKWIGLRKDQLESRLAEMRTAAGSAGSLIKYLRGLERQVTTLRFRPRIRTLMGLRTTKPRRA